MGVSIKFRRGTAAEHGSFTGAEGEITVLKSADSADGNPWRLKVHDGVASYTVPTIDSTDSLTNKTMTSPKWDGTISDTSSNSLASITGGQIVFADGAVILNNADVIDQAATKTLEAMMERVARKNQMILGD
jgi:G3E family GTPase